MLQDVVDSFFTFDSSLRQTIAGLLRNPGRLCLDYVGGRRARYLSPLRYCITALALYLLVSVLLGADPTKAVGNVTITGPSAEITEAAKTRVANNINLVMFLSLPLFAGLLRLYYWRSGHNYAEVMAFTLYVIGHVFLIATLLIPLGLVYAGLAAGARLLIQVALFTWSAKVFFRSGGFLGWLKALGVQLLYIASIFPVSLAVILYFLAVSA